MGYCWLSSSRDRQYYLFNQAAGSSQVYYCNFRYGWRKERILAHDFEEINGYALFDFSSPLSDPRRKIRPTSQRVIRISMRHVPLPRQKLFDKNRQ